MTADNHATRHRFSAYGFTFETDGPLPPAATSCFDADPIPIRLEIGAVPATLRQPFTDGQFIQTSRSEFLFKCEHHPRILINSQSVVRAECCAAGTSEQRYWDSVISVGASFVGVQRAKYPLHASAVISGGICVALSGPSGAGKSTFAAGLCSNGATLVADDLCLISEGAGGSYASYGPPHVHLLPDALTRLGTTQVAHRPNRYRKEYMEIPGTRGAAARLRKLYFLSVGHLGCRQGIRRLSRIEAMQCLIENNRLFMPLNDLPAPINQSVFKLLAELSGKLEAYELVRSSNDRNFACSVESLQDHIRMGGECQ